MGLGYKKFGNPNVDEAIIGHLTLRNIVALMDKMKGAFDVIDLPIQESPGQRKRSVGVRNGHFRNQYGGEQFTTQELNCNFNYEILGNGLASGQPSWRISLGYHHLPSGDHAVHGPKITAANLDELAKEIRYAVVDPDKKEVEDLILRDFEYLEQHTSGALANVGRWRELDLIMALRCTCGHKSRIRPRTAFATVSQNVLISDLQAKFKCSECGQKKSSMIVLDRDGRWASHRYEVGSSRKFRSERRPRTVDPLHRAVGGDGVSPVYLGDGLFIDPEGHVSEL